MYATNQYLMLIKLLCNTLGYTPNALFNIMFIIPWTLVYLYYSYVLSTTTILLLLLFIIGHIARIIN